MSELNRGQAFEQRCLGRYTQLRQMEFVNHRDAIALAKATQAPWDPADPPTLFGKGILKLLRQILAEMVKVANTTRKYRLRLYVAVDTPADSFHGIDAFVALEDVELGHEFIATLDLSLNPFKFQILKAGFIIDENDADQIEEAAKSDGVVHVEKVNQIANALWLQWYMFREEMISFEKFLTR